MQTHVVPICGQHLSFAGSASFDSSVQLCSQSGSSLLQVASRFSLLRLHSLSCPQLPSFIIEIACSSGSCCTNGTLERNNIRTGMNNNKRIAIKSIKGIRHLE